MKTKPKKTLTDTSKVFSACNSSELTKNPSFSEENVTVIMCLLTSVLITITIKMFLTRNTRKERANAQNSTLFSLNRS